MFQSALSGRIVPKLTKGAGPLSSFVYYFENYDGSVRFCTRMLVQRFLETRKKCDTMGGLY